jgi:hypothetical protein
MAVKSTPQDATGKWVSRLSGATQEITQGVARVTQAPGQAAAAKFNKWVAAMTSPQVQQKWRNNVAAVSLSDWQTAMTNIGIPRIASGAQAKQGKYLAFAEQFFPFLATGVAQIERMDDTTFEARLQRATAMMTYTHGFKRNAA